MPPELLMDPAQLDLSRVLAGPFGERTAGRRGGPGRDYGGTAWPLAHCGQAVRSATMAALRQVKSGKLHHFDLVPKASK